MSIKEMERELRDKIFSQTHTNILNLLIPEAHALGLIAALVTFFIGIQLYEIYGLGKQEDFIKTAKDYSELCKRIQDEDVQEIDINKLQDTYNALSDKALTICTSGDSLVFKGYNKQTCEIDIPQIKKCFRGKIEQVKKKLVNASGRSNVKNLQYEAVTDKYISNSASK